MTCTLHKIDFCYMLGTLSWYYKHLNSHVFDPSWKNIVLN
jgi:hypothetical protein